MAQHGEDGVGGSGEIVDEGGEVSTTLQKAIGRIRDSKFWGNCTGIELLESMKRVYETGLKYGEDRRGEGF